MKTIETDTDLDAEFEAAVERAMTGIRDPAKMDVAAREMDEGGEEIRARLGTLDLAVDLDPRSPRRTNVLDAGVALMGGLPEADTPGAVRLHTEYRQGIRE